MAISKKNKIIIGLSAAVVVTGIILIPILLTRDSSEVGGTNGSSGEENDPESVRLARLAKFHMYADTAKQSLDEARAFLKENGIPLPLFRDLSNTAIKTGPKICIGIQTAGRKSSPINYVEQTVGALLARMEMPQNDVYIHVFNVHNSSEVHKDVESIQDLVPVTRTKGTLPKTLAVEYQPQFAEAHDHREAIRVLKRIGCQYPILIEDDALPQEGWLDRVRQAIKELEERDKDWFLIKMYISREPGYERKDQSYVGITSHDQTFNGVAMMYNPKYMLDYGDSLVNHTRLVMAGKLDKMFYEFKDTWLNIYQADHKLKVEAFEPPIFQHTGIYSSVNMRPLEKFPWFMESREFVSQDLPIVFNATMWQGLIAKP